MSNEIVEFNKFEVARKEAETACDFLPDCSTEEGYTASKQAVKVAGKFLSQFDKVRKVVKQEALDRCRLIDSEAKLISGPVESSREPHKIAVKAKDEEEQRQKAEMARLWNESKQKMVDDICALSVSAGRSLDDLCSQLVQLESEVISSDYAHMREDAQTAKDTGIRVLNIRIDELKAEAAERERLAQEAAELAEKQKAFEAEQEEIRKQQAADRAAEEAASTKLRVAEAKKQAAIYAENARIAAEQKDAQDKIDAENKRIADEKQAEDDRIAKEKADKAEADRVAALAPDKEKLVAYFYGLMKDSLTLDTTEGIQLFEIFQEELVVYLERSESM